MVFAKAESILSVVKIFQFPHSTCRIIGQHALCGKENLIGREYNNFNGVYYDYSLVCQKKQLVICLRLLKNS